MTFFKEAQTRDGYMESGGKGNDVNLAFDFCGYEHCRADQSFGPLARSVYIIHFVVSGRGTFRCGDRKYNIGKNQLFLLPSGVETYYTADGEEIPVAISLSGSRAVDADTDYDSGEVYFALSSDIRHVEPAVLLADYLLQ